MGKMFADQFEEIAAEENGTESSYGMQLLKQILTSLVNRVSELEKEVERLKGQSTGFVGLNYPLTLTGVVPTTLGPGLDQSFNDLVSGISPSNWWNGGPGPFPGDSNEDQ